MFPKPHKKAQDEVRELLDQIRALTNNPVIIRASDAIEAMCGNYMAADINITGLRTSGGRHIRGGKARIFELLLARRGHVVTKESMLAACQPHTDKELSAKTIDVYICWLRQALANTAYRGSIETVHGYGYRMRTEAEMQQSRAA